MNKTLSENEAGREKGKATSWEGVRKGDTLNSVKRFLKQLKSGESLPKLPESKEPMLNRVIEFITGQGVVDAADGRRVNLANPDSWEGQPPTVRQRALHLITQSTKLNTRVRDFTRYPFVAAIPKTLSEPDLVVEGKYDYQDRVYYFRNYAHENKQRTHLVITDKNDIVDQGSFDGLLSQYPTDLTKQFDWSFKVTYKKGSTVPDASPTLLIPTNTAALSNPAGADSHAGQTGDFPSS